MRVHSECLTGDVFHSLRCDCGEQLELGAASGSRPRSAASCSTWRRRAAGSASSTSSGVRAPGGGARHRRGEPRARLPRRRARLRDRQPDPRRPRADDDPPAHEQPEEDRRDRGLRADRGRPGADRGAAERREPALSRGEARQARPPAPPPGPAIRARGERMSDEFDERRVGGAEAVEAAPEQQSSPTRPRRRASCRRPRPSRPSPRTRPSRSPTRSPRPRRRRRRACARRARHPGGFGVLEGSPDGAARRSVGIVVEPLQRRDHAAAARHALDGARRSSASARRT